jgi:hypothetical protein
MVEIRHALFELARLNKVIYYKKHCQRSFDLTEGISEATTLHLTALLKNKKTRVTFCYLLTH